MESVTIGIRII